MNFINTHVYSFTLDHIHDRFFKAILIEKLHRKDILTRMIFWFHEYSFWSEDDIFHRLFIMLGINVKSKQEGLPPFFCPRSGDWVNDF